MQGSARNILHALHEFDQIVLSAGAFGREANAAIAHDHCGHAMVNTGCEAFVPGDLAVIVCMKVNKTWRDPKACGIHDFFGGLVNVANVSDAPTLNTYVCNEGFFSRSIYHSAVFNQAIEHLFFSTHTPTTCHSRCAKYPINWPR